MPPSVRRTVGAAGLPLSNPHPENLLNIVKPFQQCMFSAQKSTLLLKLFFFFSLPIFPEARAAWSRGISSRSPGLTSRRPRDDLHSCGVWDGASGPTCIIYIVTDRQGLVASSPRRDAEEGCPSGVSSVSPSQA